jgi:hypothetical protein
MWCKRFCCFTRLLLLFLITLVPAPAQDSIETIFIVPGSHLDIGFTDTPRRVLEWRILLLDDAIQTGIERPDFVWFEEGAFSFDAWWSRNREEHELLEKVRQLFRNGQLGVGATWVTPLIAARPEALPVLTLHLEELEREFSYRPAVAVLNDVPSFPESLVDALADSGVRYLLNGANMFISNPFPPHLVRSPFWWESAKGNRLLTYIDPYSFTAAFSEWGIDPECAKFMAPERFPADLDELHTMELGINAMLRQSPAAFDAIIVQHAFDNWDSECAKRLPAAAALWNNSCRRPRIVLAQPEEYFRYIEEKYGADLPVYRGELDSDWDHQAAAMAPVWTWRLRQAAQAIDESTPRQSREALATALDHNLGLGSGGPEFTEWQVRAHTRQAAEIFQRAVHLLLGDEGVMAVPSPLSGPKDHTSMNLRWHELISPDGVELRVGPRQIGPWVKDDERLDIPVEIRVEDNRLTVKALIDRTRIPGSDDRFVNVVIDIPIPAPPGNLGITPIGLTAAEEGNWLRGQPALPLMAPHGLLLSGLSQKLQIRSPLVLSWTLVPHPHKGNITLLRGFVAAQSTCVELYGGQKIILPFEALFPGEPAMLEMEIEISLL